MKLKRRFVMWHEQDRRIPDDVDELCRSLMFPDGLIHDAFLDRFEKTSKKRRRTIARILRRSAGQPSTLFPRAWSLFRWLLPPKVRNRIYDPCNEELLEDYFVAYAQADGRYARAWVWFCFFVRTAVMFLQSLNAWVGGGLFGFLIKLLPERLRRFWRSETK